MATVRVLLISPMVAGSGNLTTARRIRNHFEQNGFPCLLKSPEEFEDSEALHTYIVDQQVGFLVAVHAFKSGKLMIGVHVPSIVILGGTDVNECTSQPDKMTVMESCLNKARYIVAFTEQLRDKCMALWPHIDEKRVQIIPQAVSVRPSDFNIKEERLKHVFFINSPPEAENKTASSAVMSLDVNPLKLFTLVGGIRPVKNPLYIARRFSEWHLHQKHRNCFFLIVGPELHNEYFKIFTEEVSGLPGVFYIPELDEADMHAVIRDSTALVNTSDSEGMSVAILEAMLLGTPVLVRAIPGNTAIVTDGLNGFVFHNEEEFFMKAEQILTNKEEVTEITHNASKYIQDNHSLPAEESDYISLFREILNKTVIT